ncbi:MAG: branched-chain amino acid transport system permease protein [Blastocatellia bacterium]|jgi:branched-chain amino acid transport system permease protein|nr:branched-chain amino acid transport system permease protein [Blastocatellia bacterium]
MSTFLQQLINGISLGAIYSLIALGYTMVYGVLKLINFAHGDVYMVGAFVGYYIANGLGARGAQALGQGADGFIARGLIGSGTLEPSLITALVVMLLAMAICAALGVIIERFAYRPVRKYSRLTALITAIGVSLLLENGGQVVFGADPKFFPELFKKRNIDLVGGASINSADIMVLVIALGLMIGLQLVVFRTKTGRAMRAVSFNLQSAKLMGINTDRIIMFTFALGSALAAAAGVLVAIRIPRIDPLMGILVGLKAFVAAVLGGIGNIPGAVLGGLLIGITETMVVGYLSPTYKDAVAFAILILILLFRPSGLLGSVAQEKV